MASAYFSQEDLELRLSKAVVQQIYDDDNTGAAKSDAIDALIADASSRVDSYLRGIYPLPLTSVPNEIKRLALDVAVAYAEQRHPEYVRRDGKALMAQAEKDLEKLRLGKTRLDLGGAPEPVSGNEGGFVENGTAEMPFIPFKVFGSMGDF